VRLRKNSWRSFAAAVLLLLMKKKFMVQRSQKISGKSKTGADINLKITIMLNQMLKDLDGCLI